MATLSATSSTSPDNAGLYEFEVDGNLLTLDQTRALLEVDDLKH